MEGLIGNDAHAHAVIATETDNQIGSEVFLDLEKVAVIDCSQDNFLHVKRRVWIFRDKGIEFLGPSLSRVVAL